MQYPLTSMVQELMRLKSFTDQVSVASKPARDRRLPPSGMKDWCTGAGSEALSRDSATVVESEDSVIGMGSGIEAFFTDSTAPGSEDVNMGAMTYNTNVDTKMATFS